MGHHFGYRTNVAIPELEARPGDLTCFTRTRGYDEVLVIREYDLAEPSFLRRYPAVRMRYMQFLAHHGNVETASIGVTCNLPGQPVGDTAPFLRVLK